MKTRFVLLSFVLFFISVQCLFSNGVVIVNGTDGIYLVLKSSGVRVKVNSQIAVVTSKQTFYNQTGKKTPFKYGFPLQLSANAIDLQWYINGKWHRAIINKGTQSDTIPGSPGDPIDSELIDYLGETPLLFTPLDSIEPDSSVIFILKYVELLPYSFGEVKFSYPNDYGLIQDEGILDEQYFSLELTSARTIENVTIENLNAQIQILPNLASIEYVAFEEPARTNYEVSYQLSSTELGVYSLSTLLPDSLLHCDEAGKGYVSLIIEPESNVNTTIIEKNFSLIIDRSGSMSGIKIEQAKAAASFIVNHLNLGDHFNIIDFSDNIKMLFPEISPYTLDSKSQALAYINSIKASGSTNISGALTTSIHQFLSVDTAKANIIIFLTDGVATAGITNTPGILDAVSTAVDIAETEIFLFTFGIGDDVDKKLLTLLALQNNGLVSFLENDELETEITNFFLKINNPVLLNTQFEFIPDIVTNVYPLPLPNLYKGQQLIMSGRYSQPGDVNLILTGKAFNLPVSYTFPIHLSDSNDVEKSFLPKIWAKQAIEDFAIDFNLPESTYEQDSIQSLIDSLSVCYGVINTQFTSFEDGGDVTSLEESTDAIDDKYEITISPDPFQHTMTIQILSRTELWGQANIILLDQQGKRVAGFDGSLHGLKSVITWNNLDFLPAGIYYCVIMIGEDMVVRKVVKA
ncbi:MAG TPA: VWA domain-containing protein [Saprospiraceae bacterium]|nr:VWA domain-containing protein [Saprospiraceae bacterium]